MLPPEGTLRAALRWLLLLSRSSYDQAAALISADPQYADLTRTQYASAIDWLLALQLLEWNEEGTVTSALTGYGAPASIGRALLSATLEQARPPWLFLADSYLTDAEDLPSDLAQVADVLEMSGAEAVLTVHQVHQKIDLAERARVGLAGESALVDFLNEVVPGSADHVALESDGLGYDIELSIGHGIWHVEVKTTKRRGRLDIYLSRHEFEIARLDPTWRLVTIGLEEDGHIGAIATIPTGTLLAQAPADRATMARWESAKFGLRPSDLQPGLPFLNLDVPAANSRQFDWMPLS